METIYLSGPMTDFENLNKEAFQKAKLFLEENGYKVINPFSIANILDKQGKQEYKDYLAHDIYALNKCDKIALLPQWNESVGARIEIVFAIACKIPIIDAITLNPITNLNLEFKIVYNEK
jgi:nucleoside 2-deoxyribosyltransferase